jgi:tripeptide aminopeptidase
VGTGIPLFDVAKLNADYAYTIDGGEVGELQFENFNAARAKIIFKGRSVHPGTSKDKMINASLVAMEYNGMLPAYEIPAHTAGYEGFYHLTGMKGDVEEATLGYIIRDHDRTRFEARKVWMERAAEWLNQKYGAGTVAVELVDQYRNMREKIEPVMHVVEIARQAMQLVGVAPLVIPVRGGTDGATLSWKGLPTPNLFTGGHNFHGKFEYVVPFAMEKSVETIVKIIELSAFYPVGNMTPDTGIGVDRRV